MSLVWQFSHSLRQPGLKNPHTGQYDEALEYLQLALPIAQERDSPEKGDVLNLLGIIFHELEDYEKSIESYKQSLDFFERDGNHQAKTMILNNLGLVYSSHGLHGLAIQHLEMAGSGEKLYEIGKEKFDQEEYHLASTYLEAALVVAQQDYNNENQGHIFSMLGSISGSKSRFEKSLEYYNQSLAIFRKQGNSQGEASVHGNVGELYRVLSNFDKALEHYNQALEIYEELGHSEYVERLQNAIESLPDQ